MLWFVFPLQDAESTDRRSKRQNKLETVNNNAKVLSEMLVHYKLESATETELDLMKVRASLYVCLCVRVVSLHVYVYICVCVVSLRVYVYVWGLMVSILFFGRSCTTH